MSQMKKKMLLIESLNLSDYIPLPCRTSTTHTAYEKGMVSGRKSTEFMNYQRIFYHFRVVTNAITLITDTLNPL